MLNDMNNKLEEIQKSLDMYLETKRQLFPRFYFLSNDDLLEILGQSRNPEAVQPHMKKCFDNVVKLDLSRMRDKWDATAMNSAGGEKVDFHNAIRLDGPVEVCTFYYEIFYNIFKIQIWLNKVEDMMRITLKSLLRACRADLKKNLNKREKWVKEWPGQVEPLHIVMYDIVFMHFY